MILKRDITRCYDCYPRAQSKTFQVCTLRTLPEKPIHCLVWAKHLFSLIFGPPSDQNLLSDILEEFDSNKIQNNEDLRFQIYTRIDHVFKKLYIDLLKEQKESSPEKFSFVKLISEDMIKQYLDQSNIPIDINFDADQYSVHDISFYISNFYGNNDLIDSECNISDDREDN